jgi:hypothetical protein
MTNKLFASLVLIGGFSVNSFAQKPGTPASQMEKLDRGVIATLSQPGKYFLSWRYLANDDKNTSFRVLRDGKVVADHLTQATSMEIDGKPDSKFQVVTLVNGVAKDISKAITPPIEFDPLLFANTPVIGIIRQLRKNTPCINNKYFNTLSCLFFTFNVKPIKNVESAIIAYPSKSKLNINPILL